MEIIKQHSKNLLRAEIRGMVPCSCNNWHKQPWYTKRYDEQKQKWYIPLLVAFGTCPQEERGKRRFVRIVQYRSIGFMDDDNLFGSGKPIFDCFKENMGTKSSIKAGKNRAILEAAGLTNALRKPGLGWLVDDCPKWAILLVEQEKVFRRKEEKTVIELKVISPTTKLRWTLFDTETGEIV